MPRLEPNPFEQPIAAQIVDLARGLTPPDPTPPAVVDVGPDAPVPLADIAPSLDPGDLAQLDALCRAKRAVSAQIAPLTKTDEALKGQLKALVPRLSLPKRVIAEGESGWDLRTTPGRETLNEAQLKIEMVKAGLPIDKVNDIVARSTKVGDPSYAVYAAPKQKGA